MHPLTGTLIILTSIPVICLFLPIVRHEHNAVSSPHHRLSKLVVLFRHGDRSPYMTFPTNPHPFDNETEWPDGPDQLTIRGKQRMLDLGQFIRDRYHDFLPENPIAVYARSSPADRCLNSASLVLAGAFPPSGRLKIHPDLNWLPIPVHTEKDGSETMLNTPSRSPCPALKRAKELQRSASDVQRFEEENSEFFKILSDFSGMVVKTLSDVDRVYDSLLTAKEEGKSMPDWATDDLMSRIKSVDDKLYCVASSSKLIQKLETGLFFDEIKRRFTDTSSRQKVFLYSTHDSRMSSFLRLVNGYDGGHPPYGASLFFEVHEPRDSDAGDPLIKIFYLSDTWSHKVTQLQPKGCPAEGECSLKQFLEGLSDVMIREEDYASECATLPASRELTHCFD